METVPRKKKSINLKGCLSCGKTANLGKRKYCSIDCRQKLRYKLNVRTGLLRALNTRYATFSFTNHFIMLDIMPFDTKTIFSFIFPRSNGNTPAYDFGRMADQMGNAWWAEKKRTNKKYLASKHLFKQASQNSESDKKAVTPEEIKLPLVKKASLIRLQLDKATLDSPELRNRVKKAFRIQAKKHHPDAGGDNHTFRKIYQAYEELIRWSENPSFVSRRGFPDKWFYDAHRNKWIQPTPAPTA
jgi:hypothetical protein